MTAVLAPRTIRRMNAMPETPTVFDVTDGQAEADAIAEAEADVAAGRTIPHETVVRWLRTWGTDDGAIRHP